jgi:hypothetical protein
MDLALEQDRAIQNGRDMIKRQRDAMQAMSRAMEVQGATIYALGRQDRFYKSTMCPQTTVWTGGRAL